MKLAFTTLGCPSWTWERIVDEAARIGFDGVELRGVAGELRLARCEAFGEGRLESSLAYARERGVAICCLDTSCVFHDEAGFADAIGEGKETVDLAVRLGVPFIRVFGDLLPDLSREEETVARVARGLQALGEYAEKAGVEDLLETHGDFSSSERVLRTFRHVSSPAVGVIWDIHHTVMYGDRERPSETWRKLWGLIRHAHVKDAVAIGGQSIPALVGEGELPLAEWLGLLRSVGYAGWLSFEWEKKWHPEIAEPDIAFPAFIRYMHQALSH